MHLSFFPPFFRCQGYAFVHLSDPDSDRQYFYSQINTAKVKAFTFILGLRITVASSIFVLQSAAWVGTILLIIVVTMYIILLIWRACVRKPQQSTEMFEPLRESEEDFVEVSGFRKV